MPKNKEIGGCAGTINGCCPDGVTPKNDKCGTNCPPRKVLYSLDVSATRNVIKNNKLFYTPLQNVGQIILSVESYINKSIIFCKFKANDSAKNNGFKSVEFKYTTRYNLYNQTQKNQAYDFVNRLPKLSIQPGFIRFTFVSNILKFLSTKIVSYVVNKGITCSYYNIRINSTGDQMNYGILTKGPCAKNKNKNKATSDSTSSSSFTSWINENWKYPVACAMAGIGAYLAKLFKDVAGKLGDKLAKYFADSPEGKAIETDISGLETQAVDEIVAAAEDELVVLEEAGLEFEDAAAALETMEYDKVTKDFIKWFMGLA